MVSSTAQSVLERLPTEALHVVDEPVAEFQMSEERRSHIEKSSMRVYDLILRPPSGQVRLANRLEEAVGRLL
jgi:hypothetical protein